MRVLASVFLFALASCPAAAFFSASATMRWRLSTKMAASSAETVLDLESARKIVVAAAVNRDQEPGSVLEALKLLERQGRTKNARAAAEDKGPKFEKLTTNGKWRLVFTTGDVKTQERLGGAKLNYIPITAVQEFRSDMTITNGVYIGSFPLLKFEGTFTWSEARSRLDFFFNRIAVLGLKFPFDQGKPRVQPGFTFIDVTEEYAAARGAGGGLALWLRTTE